MRLTVLALLITANAFASEYVNGYFRADGNYVNGYTRESPSPYGANNYGNSNLQQPSSYGSNTYGNSYGSDREVDSDNGHTVINNPYGRN